eukprot:scaffold1034_cov127-Cylindrotheca_fusiformis.AAC.33
MEHRICVDRQRWNATVGSALKSEIESVRGRRFGSWAILVKASGWSCQNGVMCLSCNLQMTHVYRAAMANMLH